jgi:hypothetical protein
VFSFRYKITANEVVAAVKPIGVRLPKLITVESRLGGAVGYRVPMVWAERKEEPQVGPGKGISANGHGGDGKWKAVSNQPAAADLEIGGAYSVPRKKRAGDVQGGCCGGWLDWFVVVSAKCWVGKTKGPFHFPSDEEKVVPIPP